MASEHVGKQEDLGFECHDCGEVYAPGADMSACINDGHYGARWSTARCRSPALHQD